MLKTAGSKQGGDRGRKRRRKTQSEIEVGLKSERSKSQAVEALQTTRWFMVITCTRFLERVTRIISQSYCSDARVIRVSGLRGDSGERVTFIIIPNE